MQNAFIGEIRPFAFGFYPYGWYPCTGATLLISQNAALYAVIGIQYGGNGTTNFQLPNLQGQVPVCQNPTDYNFYPVGKEGGQATVSLTVNNLPPHNHNVQTFKRTVVTESSLMTDTPSDTVYLTEGNSTSQQIHSIYLYSTNPPDNASVLNPNTIGLTPNPSSFLPHANMAPYLALTYCICWDGTFPMRP